MTRQERDAWREKFGTVRLSKPRTEEQKERDRTLRRWGWNGPEPNDDRGTEE